MQRSVLTEMLILIRDLTQPYHAIDAFSIILATSE